MSLTLFLGQTQESTGLPTYTYTIPSGAGGMYTVEFSITEVPPSGISVLVKQGASTVYTAPVIAAAQIGMKFKANFLFTAADVITVVVASSSAVDNLYNSVKMRCSINQGIN